MKESAPVELPKNLQLKELLRTIVGFGIPFLLITYLAFASGGYEIVPRSQVGIIAWWSVLLGILAGILPLFRPTRASLAILAILCALLLWTACGLLWTESTEHTIIELTRVATLLGVVVLLVVTQDREGLRNAVVAVAAAVVLVALVALVDRLLPNLLPFGSDYTFPEGYPKARLNYPLEYWNGLGIFIAIGVGPVLWLVAAAKSTAVRCLAAGAVPLLALAGYMTASRGEIVEVAAVLAVLAVLFPERTRLLLNLIGPAIGSALLIFLINDRPAVRDLDPGQARLDQGEQMALLVLAVVSAVALAQFAAFFFANRNEIKLGRPSRNAARNAGIAAFAVVLVVAIGAFASGFAGDKWDEFKKPSELATVDRLSNVNSGERYLVWKSAVEASESAKVTGIGPGTFEFWWARDGQGSQFVRDAHSIYLENLAELGPLGLILVLAMILGPIGAAVLFSAREKDDRKRSLLAVSAAGMAAFAISAGIDWAWELTVLPVMFFTLAVAVAASTNPIEFPERFRGSPWEVRIPMVIGSAAAMVLIWIPMKSAILIDGSQSAVRNGDLELALDKADKASDFEPWSTTALIQRAQVLRLLGRDEEAIGLAREAADKEPDNWTNWFVLSQLASDLSPQQSRAARAKAKSLNPKSPIFTVE
ncbi:MAG TPA: O-antigen ligase family protein [Solirubrobacterales bacterium]|jgi:hypothetical protein|nr:O-antigen ligase family protein [Solirubrobacterales bacterium]HNC14828.1 O-antigen ligase family protein [Solirubrobacterales bacterium]HNL63292.1 O-antigen ligase family protein [Solirubrobacterales bacterium]HNN19301.1 O-antigen ligase family protein [Solirubrobacterales bacterium]